MVVQILCGHGKFYLCRKRLLLCLVNFFFCSCRLEGPFIHAPVVTSQYRSHLPGCIIGSGCNTQLLTNSTHHLSKILTTKSCTGTGRRANFYIWTNC